MAMESNEDFNLTRHVGIPLCNMRYSVHIETQVVPSLWFSRASSTELHIIHTASRIRNS